MQKDNLSLNVNTVHLGNFLTSLSGGITRQDVERAMDSNLVKHWLKAQSKDDPVIRRGMGTFCFGEILIHEFAKARLGIDNKFEPAGVFNNSLEAIESWMQFAKGKGLDAAIADKYDFRSGSDDVQRIMEHPETIYNEQEMEEISRFFSPKAFEEFKSAVRSLSESKDILAEEERIKSYNNGKALIKAFILYDIAQRRLFAEHVGDERFFRKEKLVEKSDGRKVYQGVNSKLKEGESETFRWVLKNDVAKELMRLIATSPITMKMPLLERRAGTRITDITLYSGKDGGMFIKAAIDGRMGLSKPLSKEDAMCLTDKTDRTALAEKYYSKELEVVKKKRGVLKI